MGVDLKKCPAFQELSSQHQKFVLEYVKDFNATQAAVRTGYSAKTAHSQGPRLLEHVGVLAAIEEVKAQLASLDIASAEEVVKFLTVVMRGSMKDVATWGADGLSFAVKNTGDKEDPEARMTDEAARLIKKVKVTEKSSAKGDWTECKTEVELHDPVRAAELLGRYHGIWKDKTEHSLSPELMQYAERLEKARRRSLEASSRSGKS